MALHRPNLIRLAAPLLAFVAALTLALFVLRDDGAVPAPATGGETGSGPLATRSTDDQIRALQQVLRAGGAAPASYVALGEAYLQKARESGDPGFYRRADLALRPALRRQPPDAGARASMGALLLAQHDFRGAERYALEARRLAPEATRPYVVLGSAQMELGRYDAAGETLQRLIDMRPNLASYSLASYFRELHGDLGGAVGAMRLAVSAAGTGENAAYAQTLLGNLELERGRFRAGRRAYRDALRSFPGYVSAQAGLARADAAAGRLDPSIRRLRGIVARLPLPEYVVALGEAELAAGRPAEARHDLELVRAQQRLLGAGGVNSDAEIALFEADHGRPAEGVVLARRAWSAAPSVRSADALGWALTRSGRPEAGARWSRRALARGSRDARFLYHAGMAAKATGRRVAARRLLARALAANPTFSPLHAPRARRALTELRG